LICKLALPGNWKVVLYAETFNIPGNMKLLVEGIHAYFNYKMATPEPVNTKVHPWNWNGPWFPESGTKSGLTKLIF